MNEETNRITHGRWPGAFDGGSFQRLEPVACVHFLDDADHVFTSSYIRWQKIAHAARRRDTVERAGAARSVVERLLAWRRELRGIGRLGRRLALTTSP